MKILTAILLSSSILFAQNDTVYNYILPELKISVTKLNKTNKYLFSRDENIFFLTSKKLTADTNRYNWNYNLNEIKSLQFRNGVATWGGAFYGGIIAGSISFAYGILAAVIYKPKPAEIALVLPGYAAAGFVAGAFIGGILGSFIPAFYTYDNFSSEITIKKEQLRKILYKHDLRRKK